MAEYRTDRERRILGLRVESRRALFEAVDEAAGRLSAELIRRTLVLNDFVVKRKREEDQDAVAIGERDSVAEHWGDFYVWTYAQIPAWLQPTWGAARTVHADSEVLRRRLFTLGAPSKVAAIPQLLLDGLVTLDAALDGDTGLTIPEGYRAELTKGIGLLRSRISGATQEQSETRALVAEHQAARDSWDAAYMALRDVTRGFLRLQGRLDELDALFAPLPTRTGGQSEPEVVEPAEPVTPAE